MHCKQFVSLSVASLMLAAVLTGCGGASSTASSAASSEAASAVSAAAASESTEAALPDGVYTAEFDTDSGMFHANEACNGMGTLTVESGQMTFHVSLSSKKIVNLYVGMAADAEANKEDWLLPTTDTVTYSDGTSEEVYGYDIPVAAVDQDFQLALLGTKGKWYDHTVSIRNAQPKAEEAAETPADGEYSVNVTLEGGSGRATAVSKSDFASFTFAVRALEAVARPAQGAVELHFTYDEEFGGELGSGLRGRQRITRPSSTSPTNCRKKRCKRMKNCSLSMTWR